MGDFDELEGSYDELVARSISFGGQEHEYYTRRKTDALLDLAGRALGDVSGLRVLDVGCGIGLTDRLLARHVRELHGLDRSQVAIEEAAVAQPEVEYRSYSGTRFPYDDDSFDLVFAICVLHHVDIGEREGFAQELQRVVRPGGVVAVFEHNPRNPLTRVAVSRCPFDEDAALVGRRRAIRLLLASGLEPIEARYILFFPFERTWSRRFEHHLGRVPLGAQYYVAARK